MGLIRPYPTQPNYGPCQSAGDAKQLAQRDSCTSGPPRESFHLAINIGRQPRHTPSYFPWTHKQSTASGYALSQPAPAEPAYSQGASCGTGTGQSKLPSLLSASCHCPLVPYPCAPGPGALAQRCCQAPWYPRPASKTGAAVRTAAPPQQPVPVRTAARPAEMPSAAGCGANSSAPYAGPPAAACAAATASAGAVAARTSCLCPAPLPAAACFLVARRCLRAPVHHTASVLGCHPPMHSCRLWRHRVCCPQTIAA